MRHCQCVLIGMEAHIAVDVSRWDVVSRVPTRFARACGRPIVGGTVSTKNSCESVMTRRVFKDWWLNWLLTCVALLYSEWRAACWSLVWWSCGGQRMGVDVSMQMMRSRSWLWLSEKSLPLTVRVVRSWTPTRHCDDDSVTRVSSWSSVALVDCVVYVVIQLNNYITQGRQEPRWWWFSTALRTFVLFSPFSSFLTISLCRAGHYCSNPVFSILCHVFSQSVFLHVFLYVIPPSLFSADLCSFSQKLLVLAVSQRCGCVLASSSGQTTLVFLFSRKVSTGFTSASFLISSFLMWSNLVFPLVHLNILISAEFSLFSSFFFAAQHSEPCVIAGRMIVLKIAPDTSFHFIHPIVIILLTSACEPPSLVNIYPMYLKDVTVGSSASITFTVVSVSFVGLGKHSVFVLVIFSPRLSNTTINVSWSSSAS